MSHDVRALNQENAVLAEQLRQARQESQTARKTVQQLTEALGKYRAAADAERQVPATTIRRQWEALAVRIARQASGKGAVPLAGLDQEVVTTWQQLRQQAQTRGADRPIAKTTRPARPATPPRRRNR